MIGLPRFRQSAALPFDPTPSQRRFLLVTSLGTRRWILPKGNIDPGLTAREAAEFEAFEEAGVLGRVGSRSIGSFAYDKEVEGAEPIPCQVKVFPLEVRQMLERFPQSDQRERQWMTPSEAAAAVDEHSLKELLLKFAEDADG